MDMSEGSGAASAHIVALVVGVLTCRFSVVDVVVEVFASSDGGTACIDMVVCWLHVGGGVASMGRVESWSSL